MDKAYWDKYYQQHGKDKSISNCSTFADFCLKNFFSPEGNIVELGSGNGRDAIYFAQHRHMVTAIDQSTVAIDIEKEGLPPKVGELLKPLARDFIKEDYTTFGDIDIFYSRFTMHSITKEDEGVLLPKLYNSLQIGGLLCIEARTIKDPLYGVGEYCDIDTYSTDHRRRFINSNTFLKSLLRLGFELLYFTEKNNLSVYKDDNPVLMRIILRK